MSTLESTRDDLLEQIRNIKRVRRGQLSEQYYKRTDAAGKTIKTGPYFVWQAWIQNKKRSIRVKKPEVEAVREGTQNYQRLKNLFEQFAEVTEQITLRDESVGGKKSPRSVGKLDRRNKGIYISCRREAAKRRYWPSGLVGERVAAGFSVCRLPDLSGPA